MASDQPMKFDWGNAVKLKDSVSVSYGISEGSVCGLRTIDNAEFAQKIGIPLGTVLVLVESCDGKTAEIPEDLLELL